MAYESAAERTRKNIIEHIQQFGYLDNERLKLLTGILGSQNAHLSTHLTNLIKEGKLEVRVKKNKFIRIFASDSLSAELNRVPDET